MLRVIEGFRDGADHAILTPHAGEAAELLSRVDPEVQHADASGEEHWDRGCVEADPRGAAVRLAELTGATVVLKGHMTVIVAPGVDPVEVVAPTTRLATAGTGDVLAGMIGALVALNHGDLDCVDAATVTEQHAARAKLVRACAAAVELHGWSALEASQRNAGMYGSTVNTCDSQADAAPATEAPILAHDISHAAPVVIARYCNKTAL